MRALLLTFGLLLCSVCHGQQLQEYMNKKVNNEKLDFYEKELKKNSPVEFSKFNSSMGILNIHVLGLEGVIPDSTQDIPSSSYTFFYPYFSELSIIRLKEFNKLYNVVEKEYSFLIDTLNLSTASTDVSGFKKTLDSLGKNFNFNNDIFKILVIHEANLLDENKLKIEVDLIRKHFNKYYNSDLNSLQNLSKDIISKINSENKQKADIDKKTSNEPVTGFPTIGSYFGENVKIVPSISLLASSEIVGDEVYGVAGDMKVFTGGSQSTKIQNLDVLYSDISSFGVQLNGQLFLTPGTKKNLGIGVNATTNFLGKSLPKDTISTINSSVFHFRIGGQAAFIKNVLSGYFNQNIVYFISNKKEVTESLNLSNGAESFGEFGFKGYFTPAKNKVETSLNFTIDLNFLIAKKEFVKNLTDDPLIPSIRISVGKSF